MEFSITSESCRVCLKKPPNSKLFSDFFHAAEKFPQDVTTGTDRPSLLDLYQLVVVGGSTSDALLCPPASHSTFFPLRICNSCEVQLVVAFEFRRKSTRSEMILRNILSLYEEEQFPGAAEVKFVDTKEEGEGFGPQSESVVEYEESVKEFEDIRESVVEIRENASLDGLVADEDIEETSAVVDLGYQQIEHDYEVVTDVGFDQKHVEVEPALEEPMDAQQDYDSNDEDDGEFYEVDLTEPKTKSVSCPDCGKVVSTRYLSKHREIHKHKSDRVKPFVCDQCQARFTLKENLQKHKRIHSNEKKYSCPYCQQQFLHWASRRYHIDSRHTGEKRFTCEYCEAKFRNSSHYAIHIRRHTGVLPYSCCLCDRSFVTGNSLKLHLASHSDSKDFSCDICPRTYKSAKTLRIHKRSIHEQEKNYICPLCGRPFSQNHVLRTHLLKNHPHYEPPPPGTVVNARAVRRNNESLLIGEGVNG